MNIKLNEKIIKDMCGTVSFKRGDSFYRAHKVTMKECNSDYCAATVTGQEDFHVTIEKDENGSIQRTCSCPSLSTFPKDCQHIAAVLLTIYHQQLQDSIPVTKNPLTEGLMNLFHDQPLRPSGRQPHFETRQELDVSFMVKPVEMNHGQYLFSIEIKVGSTVVQNIRAFLMQLKQRKPAVLSVSLTFDANLYCFAKEVDAVLDQLIEVSQDLLPDQHSQHHLLLLPPAAWERLLPLLQEAPLVKLKVLEQTFDGIQSLVASLPLQFDFMDSEGKGFQLNIQGMDHIMLMASYSLVLYDGKIKKLAFQDAKRLHDLKQLLADSKTNQIPIPEEQTAFFLEKVIPSLKRLGTVQISEAITRKYMKTPLMAHLYLDRVKNRLLAGLEFHYENVMINPLENKEQHLGAMLIRDEVKEAEILQIMEESSLTKTEGGYFLHHEELEYEFLYRVVPQLQKLVQIYATTAVRNRIFKGHAHPQIRVSVKKERTNWLEFNFAMDGIPDKDIQGVLFALEEKRKYYRLRSGMLLSLETKEFEEINRFLHESQVEPRSLKNGLDLPMTKILQLLDHVDGSHMFKYEASFRQFLENIRHPGSLDFVVPKHLQRVLKDYQKLGFKWMKTLASFGFGGILADDMGLGKTLQSITFIVSELPAIRNKKCPVLIVCPSSLTYNWLHEFRKFAPDVQVTVVDGKKTERLKDMSDQDVVVISYPLLRRDISWFEKQVFHTVFFDEAQFFKNPLTQTARAVKRIQANYRFALTGTPIENAQEELWAIFHVVFPELFLSLKHYSHLSRQTISRRIQPFLLRRLKEDVLLDFPEKIDTIESVALLPEQKKLYAAYLAKLRHDTLKHLDKDTLQKNRIKILAGLTRLRQICCHPSLFVDGYQGSSAKFEQLMHLVEAAKLSGRRVLIFSQFTKMLELIGREIVHRQSTYFYLDGQTPSEQRVDLCNRFNNGERDVFLISLKAGGTGLNLTGADTVILYDAWWNPAVEEQAADRAHRMGQTNVVQVIKLVTRGTIEEKINELQEKKRHLIEDMIHSEEKAPTLTEADIRDILLI